MPAHRGFVWMDLHVTGRAAHGSRWDIGIDAIRHAGLFLAELDRYDATELTQRSHALLGRPSVHASTISGGSGMSTYPDTWELAPQDEAGRPAICFGPRVIGLAHAAEGFVVGREIVDATRVLTELAVRWTAH